MEIVPIEDVFKCEICDYISIPLSINGKTPFENHHIIPEKYNTQRKTGGNWDKTTFICCNCHKELHALLDEKSFELCEASDEEKMRIGEEAINILKNRKGK